MRKYGELVPDDLVEKVVRRRLCSRCGLDYNLISHRPAVADVQSEIRGRLGVERPPD